MRIIGRLENESIARTFSDFLYINGIQNQVESENDGSWVVWIHGEDEIESARMLLKQFLINPSDPEFQRTAKQAREKRAVETESTEAAERRFLKKQHVFRNYGPYANGPLTLILIAASILVYLLQEIASDNQRVSNMVYSLYISDPRRLFIGSFYEIKSGQVWRLITPIFLHFHILHIFFNMLWLKDLGSMVEARETSLRLAALIVSVAAASNVGQYVVTDRPAFGGMSGVVYGLLGYVWIRGKFDPASGYFLHPTTVTVMLIWFVLCLVGIIPHVANTVHAVGLLMGIGWGYVSARRA